MRTVRLLIVVVLALAVASAPAAASAPDKPQFRDRCGEFGNTADFRATQPWLDICEGWFETLSAADVEAVPEVRVSLQLASDVQPRTPAFYTVVWAVGDRVYQVARDDLLGLDGEVWLHVVCEPFEGWDCAVADLLCEDPRDSVRVQLGDGAWTEDGDTVSWMLRFDGDLAAFADDHRHGTRLDVRTALTATWFPARSLGQQPAQFEPVCAE
jgi:hypothetical protein